jgi:hypothetical protein
MRDPEYVDFGRRAIVPEFAAVKHFRSGCGTLPDGLA